MTISNIDVKASSMQEKPSYDFSLVHAEDLMNEINDIQCFLSGAAIDSLASIVCVLNDRQSDLLSEVSIILHYLKTH